MKIETVLYKTTDLYLAAFLRVRKWFVRLERDGSKCTFAFVDDPDLQKDILAYFNDGDVGAISFKNELQNLKTLMYNT
jgi:hypothetical protein